MPNSIVDSDSAGHWGHMNGEDVYRIHKHASALPGSAIRAHVDRAPTVFSRESTGSDAPIRDLAQHGNCSGVFGSR